MNSANCFSASEHEVGFVEKFVLPDRRDRWFLMLSEHHTRQKILHRLAGPIDLDGGYVRKLFGTDCRDIAQVICGAQRVLGDCYLMSEAPTFDRLYLPLDEALTRVVGCGLGTVVSCIPGELAFYESEQGGRYLLIA